MAQSKMYSLIVNIFILNNIVLLPGAQQHLLDLVDQFFLGNPEERLQSFIHTVIITLETLSLSIKTQENPLEFVSADRQGFRYWLVYVLDV